MGSAAERKIVVGVDGSEPSKRALRWAIGQAELTGAEVHAVSGPDMVLERVDGERHLIPAEQPGQPGDRGQRLGCFECRAGGVAGGRQGRADLFALPRREARAGFPRTPTSASGCAACAATWTKPCRRWRRRPELR